ncbi:MAG: FAD-dependent oxidoreductase [Parasphingorhabdus sp.]
MIEYDVAIIGAGIAGASMASELASHCSVLLLEAEDQPGYHATGRSAAFWTETYGGPQIQPLTTASRQFLEFPDPEFSEHSFLKPRGAINIATADQPDLADKFVAQFEGSGVVMEKWDRIGVLSALPNAQSDWTNAVYEPDCCDIDVSGLHQSYLRDAKRRGVTLKNRARVEAIQRIDGKWQLTSTQGEFACDRIINAAGAWADEIARMAHVNPVGIQPMRRTMVQLQTNPASNQDDPLVVALDGSFYFKPESGGSYWLSPHDEIPSDAVDAAPEELDVAIAIDRFGKTLDVEIQSVARKWAGLRSFAPDRLPVYGYDPDENSFFWFAGQGGFGIQTAPAAARLAKALFLGEKPDTMVQHIGATIFAPDRFR